LQAALDAARPGGEVILEAGATFEVNALLRPRDGTTPVTLTSSRAAEIPAGGRVTPTHAPLMPKIVTPNSEPAIGVPVFSHHWRLQCLEVTSTAPQTYDLIRLGEGTRRGRRRRSSPSRTISN
jgi:hypothetical protein